jgi:spore coat-associated protein N
MNLMRSLGTSRIRMTAITSLAVVSVGAGAMSMAVFTDEADVDNNNFSTGTVVISTDPATALFTVTDMLPGDTAGPQALTVENEGSVALTYTMSTSATDPDSKGLRDQLTLVIREMDTDTAGCANFNGTQLYSGALSGGAISSERTLAASASEVLCFRVNLDLSTGNAFQGATTAATFTFSAEQD